MRTSSICCRSFRQDASVTQASKPVLHLHTLLVLAALGRSKNTVMPSPSRRTGCTVCPRLSSATVDVPSQVTCSPWSIDFFFFFRTKRTLKGLMGFIYLPTANTGSEGIAERKECLGQEGQRPHLPCWLWPWQSPCGRRSMSFFTWFQDLSRLESASMVTISFLLLRILEGGRLAGCWTLQY